MRTYHRVQIEADSAEDVPDAINDLDSALLCEEIYDRASWDVEDLDNIKEVHHV